jgi:hypothetical protein
LFAVLVLHHIQQTGRQFCQLPAQAKIVGRSLTTQFIYGKWIAAHEHITCRDTPPLHARLLMKGKCVASNTLAELEVTQPP